MSKSQLSWLIVALALAGVAVITGHPAWGTATGVALIALAGAFSAGAAWIQSGRESEDSKGQRVPTNLVTLSAAAIIAVYATGFQRTRAANEEFEAQAARRRAHTPVASLVVPPKAAQTFAQGASQPESPQAGKSLSTFATVSPPAGPTTVPANGKEREKSSAPNVSSTATSSVVTETPQPEPAPAVTTVASSAAPATIAATETPAAAPAATPATAQPVATPSATPADASAPAASDPATAGLVMPKLHYKDGTYLGWGRCAHGRIQASVTIKDGRIASADVARCETAYSCDVIAALPGRVLMKQDSDVDGITGATDSSYAFQDAVAAAMFRGQRGE